MSLDSAQKILDMYTASNEARLNQALELAMGEAQAQMKSEMAIRKALLQQLETEQEALNAYIKTLQTARTAQRRGQFDLARANIVDFQKAQAKYEREYASYDAEQQRLADANAAIVDKAKQEGQKRFLSDGGMRAKFSTVVEKLGRSIQAGEPEARRNMIMLQENFDQLLQDAATRSRDRDFQDLRQNSTSTYVMSDLHNELLNQIALRAGVDVSDPQIQAISSFMLDKQHPNVSGRGGALTTIIDNGIPLNKDAIDYYREQFEDEYVDKFGKKGTKKKPRMPTSSPIAERTGADNQLIARARPVLDALSAGDDTPFEITAEEQATLTPDNVQAYKDLKDRYRVNPNVVNVDDAALLDDIALSRALTVEKLKQKAATPMAKPVRAEDIQYRAAEIYDPATVRDRARDSLAGRPAYEQKYFATERKALELSNQDDNYVRGLGTPEAFGVAKWKETFDGSKITDEYANIVGDIETQFPKPDDQLRALAAYNSRAMAFNAAKTPIMVSPTEQNAAYEEALKAMTPKGSK
jgi:hypothetical protein